MKICKKLFALLLTAALLAVLAVSALAAGNTTTITVSGGATGAVYSAYAITEELTVSGSDANKNYAYRLDSAMIPHLRTAAQAVHEARGAYELADFIDTDFSAATAGTLGPYMETFTEAETRLFADTLYRALRAADVTPTYPNVNGMTIPYGYYLFAETTKGAGLDTYSAVMLVTADAATKTISTKEDLPTLTKKLNAGTTASPIWQDATDAAIGDTIQFRLTSHLPKTMAYYESYTYIIHDTLSSGLTLDPSSFQMAIYEGDTVRFTNEKIRSAFQVQTASTDDPVSDTEITITCVAAKGLTELFRYLDNPDACQLVVTYNATLNNNAVFGGDGNPNTAYLQFSDDPYNSERNDPNHSTVQTAVDKVTVFTYQVIVNKVKLEPIAENPENTAPLEGAGFTLYRAENGSYLQYGSELVGGDLTTFNFKGLDAGIYRLSETTVPNGYHPADDVYFTIEATYLAESASPTLGSLTSDNSDVTVNMAAGSVTITVLNETGLVMPSTGGMGTTLFYIIGGILAVGAGVLLITRKRMEKSAD